MTSTTPVLVFLVARVLAAPANADIEVDPLPNSPGVSLDGIVITRPDEPDGASDPAPAAPNEPVVGGPTTDPGPNGTTCELDSAGVVQCHYRPVTDEEPDGDDERTLTEGDVLRATRTIGLPSLAVQVQPGDETLVNVPTIFYAEPRPFARSVDLLGFDVDLSASPVQYVWNHGDGTATSTTTPGRPYPAMEITHRYRKPAKNVRPRVDVTYRVRFRVDGGPWQTIGQTLLASGPAAQLQVSEAAPVLTKR